MILTVVDRSELDIPAQDARGSSRRKAAGNAETTIQLKSLFCPRGAARQHGIFFDTRWVLNLGSDWLIFPGITLVTTSRTS